MQNQQLILGLPFIKIYTSNLCEGCTMGKYSMSNFLKQGFIWASSLLDLIHSDVCGPIQTHSFNKVYHFVAFIDDLSQFRKVCFMWSKSDVFSKFQFYKTFVKTEIGRKIKKNSFIQWWWIHIFKIQQIFWWMQHSTSIFHFIYPPTSGIVEQKIAHWWNLFKVCSN